MDGGSLGFVTSHVPVTLVTKTSTSGRFPIWHAYWQSQNTVWKLLFP